VHSSTWIFPAEAVTSSAFLGQPAVAKGQNIETHEEMGHPYQNHMQMLC
jgi:hypothetical protein